MLPECRGQRILASHVGIIFWRQVLLAAGFGLGFRRWILLVVEFWRRILALEIFGGNYSVSDFVNILIKIGPKLLAARFWRQILASAILAAGFWRQFWRRIFLASDFGVGFWRR